MELTSHFQHSEIGLIPTDWNVKTVGELADVKTGPFGAQLHERDYVLNGTPIITVEHLGEFGVEVDDTVPKVSDEDRERLGQYILRENDIVFSRVGSVDRNALIRANEDGWLFSGRLLRVRPYSEINATFLSYHFHSEPFIERIKTVAVGQTMASLNTKILKSIFVLYPPDPKEQQAIAEALSDVDDAICALDRLIAKKRDIKQGTMQELLTGKRRLPGFSGEWGIVRLDEVVNINMGQSPSSKYYNHNENGLPLIQGNADIKNRRSIQRVWTTHATKVCDQGDLILTVRAPVGFVGVASQYSCIGRGVCSLKPVNANSAFLFHMLVFVEDQWKTLEQGSTFNAANSTQIAAFPLQLPCDLEEQQAVAELLSDMDAEIAALEAQQDKTRAIKQGMMQELLTGRTRLI